MRAPVSIWAVSGKPGESCSHEVTAGRFAWLQVLEGILVVEVDGEPQPMELRGGDALQLETVTKLTASPATEAKWLWFDLP